MFTATHRWICLSLFVVLMVLDQVTKFYALGNFPYGAAIDVLPVLKFTLAFNEGIGLSMFSFLHDWLDSASQLIFGVISLTISAVVLYIFRAETRLIAVLGWTLVVAGALGNAIDRFIAVFTWRTGVVDFISVHWANLYHFPVFNIADCAITVGFAVVLVDMLFLDKRTPGAA